MTRLTGSELSGPELSGSESSSPVLSNSVPSNSVQAALVQQMTELLPVDGVVETAVPGLTIMRSSSVGERQAIVYEPCIYLVAQGRKCGYLDDEVFTYDALHYLVLTVPLPLSAHVVMASEQHPYLAMRLNIDLAQLQLLLIEMEETDLAASDHSSRGIFVSTMNEELVESMLRLTKMLDSKQRSKVLGPTISKEILYYVMCDEQGHLLKSFAQSNRHDHQIASVIHYIHKNYYESIEVTDLAQIANMSASSLHYHFKTVTRLSPMQYIKSIRLHQAKRIISDESQTISEAAFRVGYASPSQFSREYKRLFGVVPSQSVRQAVGNDHQVVVNKR